MSLHVRPRRLLYYAAAEFRRILGSRSYWLYHTSILFVTLLFAFDLYFHRSAFRDSAWGRDCRIHLPVLRDLGCVVCRCVWLFAHQCSGQHRTASTGWSESC